MDAAREQLIQQNLLLLKYRVQEQRLGTLWQQFLAAGLNPIMIKGWAAAIKYPNPAERLYVDVDLVFDTSEFTKAKQFVEETQFEMSVDLHEGARHLDSHSFQQLFDNSQLLPCGETQVRVPCEEDHLRIICVHWLNDGGGYKDRLWDIYHAVNNRSAEFNWDKCLNTVTTKRRRWVVSAIAIAHRYLDLPVDDLPFKDELGHIPSWIYRAVEKEWASGLRLMPLHYYLNDRGTLWKQIKKRIPPNPLTATILVNGEFDNTPRIFYQLANTVQRLAPSWDRIRDAIARR